MLIFFNFYILIIKYLFNYFFTFKVKLVEKNQSNNKNNTNNNYYKNNNQNYCNSDDKNKGLKSDNA